MYLTHYLLVFSWVRFNLKFIPVCVSQSKEQKRQWYAKLVVNGQIMVASPRSIGLHVSIWPPRRPVNFQLNPIHGTGNQRGLVRLGFCKFPTEGSPRGPTTKISSSLTTRAGPIGFQVTQRQTQRNPEWQRQLLFVPTYQGIFNCCRAICEPTIS